eukprot:454578_1
MKLSLVMKFACLLNIVSISSWKIVRYPPSIIIVLDEYVNGKEAIQYCEERYGTTFPRNDMNGKVIVPSGFKDFGCNSNYMWIASSKTCPDSCTFWGAKCSDPEHDPLDCTWRCDYVKDGSKNIQRTECNEHLYTCVICRDPDYDYLFD